MKFINTIRIIAPVLVITIVSCQSAIDKNGQNSEIQTYNEQSEIRVYYEQNDTTTLKYILQIKTLPEYMSWEFNSSNPDTSRIIGYSDFVSRNVITNHGSFYHIELMRHKYNKPIDSFIYPTELVCYFRVDPLINVITVLNENSNVFLDLNSDPGRKYFKSCLDKK